LAIRLRTSRSSEAGAVKILSGRAKTFIFQKKFDHPQGRYTVLPFAGVSVRPLWQNRKT
jgi:hypothetical protein